MTSQFQIFQRRFGNARPGLQLIAVEDAAIPVTVVRADVLAQEKKKLPITEEFTLRFVALGVDTPEEIAGHLGLDSAHVLDAAAAQVSESHLWHAEGQLELTPLGGETVRTLAATQPVLQQLPVKFDRLTWQLADYPTQFLIEKKEALERGMTILPAAQKAAIGLDYVTPAGFNALLKQDKIQVLRVHKVTAGKHRYLPAKLLVYADQTRRELELAVCIDDDLADEHGHALDRIEAVKRLGLSFGDAEPRPVLDAELEGQRVPTSPLDDEAAETANANAEAGQSPPSTGITALVRGISVYEHADLLQEALSTARQRLLIISPWVKKSVVTTDFLALLEQRLRRDVEATIAHGIGDDEQSDEYALSRLTRLARRYPKFSFVRLKNTHAKILIYDGTWISTSFNWLSFRGDANRTYRMEEGTLVTIPTRVSKEYARYRAMIEEQRLP